MKLHAPKLHRAPPHLRPRRGFRPRRWPFGLGLLAALAVALVGAGCELSRPGSRDAFTPEEEQLIEESLQLMRLRIERARDPERAEEMARTLSPLLDEQALQAQLDRLAADASRGKRVLDAIHDSLQAMRNEIFPPTQGGAEDGQAVPRVGERPEPGGPRSGDGS